MRLASRFWELLVVPTLFLVACDQSAPPLEGGKIYPVGSEVRPRFGHSQMLTIDETPVRVDLYPYEKNDVHRRDFITGPPISFVFPTSAYAISENIVGGPQSSIRLHIDRETMESIGSLLGRWRDRPRSDIYQGYYARYAGRDLQLKIAGYYVDSTMEEEERYFDRNSGLSDVVGSACGFELKRRIHDSVNPTPPSIVDGFNFGSFSVEGRATNAGNPSRTLVCLQSTNGCRVSFGFANRVVSYGIDKERLCEHPQLTRRIHKMLARHRVL